MKHFVRNVKKMKSMQMVDEALTRKSELQKEIVDE